MAERIVVEALVDRPFTGASINRIVCLRRHWAWADEAMARFERELATGWEYSGSVRRGRAYTVARRDFVAAS